MTYLDNNNLLHSNQFGFRPKCSTELANCYLLENIKSFLDRGNVVGAVFVDLKKAFDTVNHDILHGSILLYEIGVNRSPLVNLNLIAMKVKWAYHKDKFLDLCCLVYISMTSLSVAQELGDKCMLTILFYVLC